MAKKPAHEVVDETKEDEIPPEPVVPPVPAEIPGRIEKANVKPLLDKIEAGEHRIHELERAVKTMLKVVQHMEKKFSKTVFPVGTFLGISFGED